MADIEQIPKERRTVTFSCQKCGNCCRTPRGDFSVSLYFPDMVRAAKAVNRDLESFVRAFCTPVTETHVFLDCLDTSKRFELKKKAGGCIFLKDNLCNIYEARPFTCKTGPFVYAMLSQDKNWEAFASECHGLGSGKVYEEAEILSLLEAEEKQEKGYEKDFENEEIFSLFFGSHPPIPVLDRRVIFSCNIDTYFESSEVPVPEVLETWVEAETEDR